MASTKPKRTMFSRTSFYIDTKVLIANASATHGGHFACSMYVEHLEPARPKNQEPIIMIHGDFHTGQIWTTKPDGQPGWAEDFVSQGRSVYIVDLPCTGRSACSADTHGPLGELGKRPSRQLVQDLLTAPEKSSEQGPWPGSKDHDEWPGTGCEGDQTFEQYYVALQPVHHTTEHRQMLCQAALVALLEKTRRAKLIGQGTGANMAMLAADKVPEFVSSIVSIEPCGPPFGHGFDMGANGARVYGNSTRFDPDTRPYGLSQLSLKFDPPAKMPTIGYQNPPPLDVVCQDLGGGQSRYMQEAETKSFGCGEPGVRILKNLSIVHHLVVTSPTSSHFATDGSVVEFMRQAGCNVVWWKLANKAITGNGHLMFLERNSADISSLVGDWWATVPDKKPATTLKRGNKGPKVRVKFSKPKQNDPDLDKKTNIVLDDDDEEPVKRKRRAGRGKQVPQIIDLCTPVISNAVLPTTKPPPVQRPRKRRRRNVRFADQEAELAQTVANNPELADILTLRTAGGGTPQESNVDWALQDYGPSPLCTDHDMSQDMTTLQNPFPSFALPSVQPSQPGVSDGFDYDSFFAWAGYQAPIENAGYVNPQDLMAGPAPDAPSMTDHCGQGGSAMSPVLSFTNLQLYTVT